MGTPEHDPHPKETPAADLAVVDIHGLGASGDGVGRLEDGRVVFVEGALPGDKVRVRLDEQRKKVQYGHLVSVLAPSPQRVGSLCPVDRCGGCPWRTFSAAGQAEAKASRVRETLRRIGHLEVDALLGEVRQPGDGWGYRHRVRLHAAHVGERWEVGYYARRSRTVLPFTACPVLAPPLSEAAARLSSALGALPREIRLEQVELAYSRRDARVAARITAQGSLGPLRAATERLEAAGLSGLEVEGPEGRWRHGNLEMRLDHARAETFGIRFEPGVFTQANPVANDALVRAVVDAVRPRESPRVLELHAGIGNFTLALAHAGARLVAVERERRAAIFCRRNTRRAGHAIEVMDCSDAEALVRLRPSAAPSDPGPFEVVVMDPPRTGAAPATALLIERPVSRVVYVSCDPATLARDSAALCRGGYDLRHLEAFDMFPQTPHVEVLALFEHSAAAARPTE